MIQLDGRKRQRPLEDQEFIEIAKFLPQAIINLINSLNKSNQASPCPLQASEASPALPTDRDSRFPQPLEGTRRTA